MEDGNTPAATGLALGRSAADPETTDQRAGNDVQRELNALREECARLRKERNDYQDDFKAIEARFGEYAGAKLTLLSHELAEQIKNGFYSRVKAVLWIAGILFAVATLGGFLTIKDLARQAIDEAIQRRESDFKRLTDTGLDDVVKLRTDVQLALAETRRVTSAANADALRKSADIAKQAGRARDLILETTRYWDAAKVSIDRADGKLETPKDKSRDSHTEQVVNCLRDAAIHDADVDVFYGVLKNDLNVVKDAMDRGANPTVTLGDLIQRHRDVMRKNCPSLLPRE